MPCRVSTSWKPRLFPGHHYYSGSTFAAERPHLGHWRNWSAQPAHNRTDFGVQVPDGPLACLLSAGIHLFPLLSDFQERLNGGSERRAFISGCGLVWLKTPDLGSGDFAGSNPATRAFRFESGAPCKMLNGIAVYFTQCSWYTVLT